MRFRRRQETTSASPLSRCQRHWQPTEPPEQGFNAAVGSARSRLLPQGRCRAAAKGEIDLSDQIDEVVREVQAGEA